MENIFLKKPQTWSEAPGTPPPKECAMIRSVLSVAVDNISGRIYVLKVVISGCFTGDWTCDRLLAFSEEGENIYNHVIHYNYTNIFEKEVGSTGTTCTYSLHGIAFHNKLIYITNRSSKVISVLTENMELICKIQMPYRSSVYTSNVSYPTGVGLVKEARGSTRLDVDEDGLFMCHYNSVLAMMHGMKPVYYEIVKDSRGQTLDIAIHKDRLHVLSRDKYMHATTVVTKDGIYLYVCMQEENIRASLTLAIDKSGFYYLSDGVFVNRWEGNSVETVYTDQINNIRYNTVERGIKFDSKERLIILECYDVINLKVEFCTI